MEKEVRCDGRAGAQEEGAREVGGLQQEAAC